MARLPLSLKAPMATTPGKRIRVGAAKGGEDASVVGAWPAGVAQLASRPARAASLAHAVATGLAYRAVVDKKPRRSSPASGLHPFGIGARGGSTGAVAAGGRKPAPRPVAGSRACNGLGGQANHHPSQGLAGATLAAMGGHRSAAGAGSNTIGARRGGEQRFFPRGLRHASGAVPKPDRAPQRKKASRSTLAPPQLSHRRLQSGQAEQLEPADPQATHDLTTPQCD